MRGICKKVALMCGMVFALSMAPTTALAATVVNNSGGMEDGSFRKALQDASTGEIISFSNSVQHIVLDANAATSADNVAVSGRPAGFSEQLSSLLKDFGINRDSTVSFPKPDSGNVMVFSGKTLETLSLPQVILDGADGPFRLLDFTATGASVAIVEGVTLQNSGYTIKTDNVDNASASRLGADASVDSTNPLGHGGALHIAAMGAISQCAMVNNTFNVTTGVAKAGGNDSYSFVGDFDCIATAEASLSGGGVYAEVAVITSSLFQGNTVNAWAGESHGIQNLTQTGGDGKLNALSTAGSFISGAGAYLGNGTVRFSVFADNSAFAYGGIAHGTSNCQDISSLYSIAYSWGLVSGVGAYVNSGSIFSSLFQNNYGQAQGGTSYASTNISSSVTNKNVDFTMGAYSSVDVQGMGAYVENGNITSSVFLNNVGSALGGTAYGGEMISATNTTGDSISIYTGLFNRAYSTGAGAYLSKGSVFSSLFAGNRATAQGGLAYGSNDIYVEANSSGLSKTVLIRAESYASGIVQGCGAVVNEGNIESSIFIGNSGLATGGAAHGSDNVSASNPNGEAKVMASVDAFAMSYGGGAYMSTEQNQTSPTVKSSIFIGNTLNAVGGEAYGATNSSGNSVYSWANADAYAFGGGLFIKGYWTNNEAVDVEICDSLFSGNSTTASASGAVTQNGTTPSPEALALGGAIFVDTCGVKTFTLAASNDNQTIITGNTANNQASGIHFGSSEINPDTGYFYDSIGDFTFTVEAKGDIVMYDPISAELYSNIDTGSVFTMNVNAPGSFVWGGTNVLDANGGSNVNFKDSTVTLIADFTLTTSDRSGDGYRTGSPSDAYARSTTTNSNNNAVTNALQVTIDNTTLLVDPIRDGNVALFDFTRSSCVNQDDNLTVTGGVLGLDTSRILLSFGDTRYLVADGISNTDRDQAYADLTTVDNVTGLDATIDNQLWMTARYDSPYQATFDSWVNLSNAASALETLLNDRGKIVLDADVVAIKAHIDSAAPDQVLNRAASALSLSDFVVRNALRLAFPVRSGGEDVLSASESGYMSLTGGRRPVVRLWGGYIGAFEQVRSHDRYRGYHQNSNGFLSGIARDFTSGTVGGYIGYTNTRLRMKDGNNGRVNADGYHLGLIGRMSPFRDVPELNLSGDFGFAYYDNSSRRYDGTGTASGDFAQRVWTASAAVGYEARIGRAVVTPFASLRWINLDQNALQERGGMTSTSVWALSGHSLASELGVRKTSDWRTGCVTVSSGMNVAWRHEFGDRDVSTSASYNAVPGLSYRLSSTAHDRDAVMLGASVSARRELSSGRSIGGNIAYNAAVGNHRTEHSIAAMLELSF